MLQPEIKDKEQEFLHRRVIKTINIFIIVFYYLYSTDTVRNKLFDDDV